MSDISSILKMNADKDQTDATSVTSESVASGPAGMPGAPPPTRTNTVAGELPDHEYIHAKLANQTFSTPPTSVKAGGQGVRLERSITEETLSFMEANNWAEIAEEDLALALKRMATAAEDKHQADDSKSPEHYYSLAVAKAIEEGPMAFKKEYLK